LSDKVKFRCPGCSKVLAASAEKAGKKAKCPGCGKILAIPQPKAKAKTNPSASADLSASADPQVNFRFVDGFTHGPKFNAEASEGYDLGKTDHSMVLEEKAKLLRANIEIGEKERASYWEARMSARFFALVIDYLIVSVPASLILLLTGGMAEISDQVSSMVASFGDATFDGGAVKQFVASCAVRSLPFMILWMLYQGLLVGSKGATIGRMATKVMIVKRDLYPVGLGRAFARGAAYLLSLWFPLLFIVGFFTVGKRMLHDLIAGTMVTRSVG
jgi:uncharacterized RDD family membrane protein YckC/ribosomal protein S27E